MNRIIVLFLLTTMVFSADVIEIFVPGSPPPEDYDDARATINRNTVILHEVPTSSWVFGCGPTSGQMLAGYYDRNGYNNIYTGPTDNGLFPLDNSSWGVSMINGETRNLGPLSASMLGVDGRNTFGHVDDYWYQDGSNLKSGKGISAQECKKFNGI